MSFHDCQSCPKMGKTCPGQFLVTKPPIPIKEVQSMGRPKTVEVNEMYSGAPMCFDSNEQWDLWRNQARQSIPLHGGYCEDCTADYQTKMIAQNRCAHPEVTFHLDKDGFVSGFRVTPKRYLVENEERASTTPAG